MALHRIISNNTARRSTLIIQPELSHHFSSESSSICKSQRTKTSINNGVLPRWSSKNIFSPKTSILGLPHLLNHHTGNSSLVYLRPSPYNLMISQRFCDCGSNSGGGSDGGDTGYFSSSSHFVDHHQPKNSTPDPSSSDSSDCTKKSGSCNSVGDQAVRPHNSSADLTGLYVLHYQPTKAADYNPKRTVTNTRKYQWKAQLKQFWLNMYGKIKKIIQKAEKEKGNQVIIKTR